MLRLELEDADIVTLDGSTDDKHRSEFNDKLNKGSARIGLMTTKTGGVGLNLQSANHVILYTHSYNPTWTNQTVHRIYRKG